MVHTYYILVKGDLLTWVKAWANKIFKALSLAQMLSYRQSPLAG